MAEMPEHFQRRGQTSTDVLREEWKRGFIEGHALGRASITTVLETLDVLIGEGLSYQEARDMIDRVTKTVTV